MDKFSFVVFCLLLHQGHLRGLPEEDSVVSVYTKEAAPGVDVYHQIANNIAERITSPIYRFLGYNRTTPAPETTTKHNWDKIEILETQNAKSFPPVNNDIGEKDVEELSEDINKKTDRKPEKFTLYSNYLPLGKLEFDSKNDTKDDDDDFGFDDVESDEDIKPRQGPFTFVLELMSSLIQLIYGGIVAIFQRRPAQTS
ncbi:unnamed protein product [Pieris macdunnoughi]|uniref:Uncharacterized protein n=1 Tax=Pieris macdunnoughi TaxID=345717 RepID=A0A821PDS9_9NEOP|nr:unnamed protein product [Pieris macdunnoughi]